ncbi:MAG: hypothetical protein L0027_11175, partial [Candidatus Rokubacteria bacterium]|nr:hypothetical protein [Candidatus Rokubacteria bacterium]
MLAGGSDVVIEHNTAFTARSVMMAEGVTNPNFVFQNNLTTHGRYGFGGTGTPTGLSTLDRYFVGAVFTRNVLIGAGEAARSYPPGNFTPEGLDQVGFVNATGRDYRLGSRSPYRNAGSDGKDIGVDWPTLMENLGPPSAAEEPRS